MTLTDWATTQPDRCPGCGMHTTAQGCICAGLARKASAQAAVTAARPTEADAVEQAIRQLAASGRPFSANDARQIHGVKGGVVGATFTALHKAGVIEPCGDETSTDAGTHGHRLYQWRAAA